MRRFQGRELGRLPICCCVLLVGRLPRGRAAALAAARRAGDTAAEGKALNSLGSAYLELPRVLSD